MYDKELRCPKLKVNIVPKMTMTEERIYMYKSWIYYEKLTKHIFNIKTYKHSMMYT